MYRISGGTAVRHLSIRIGQYIRDNASSTVAIFNVSFNFVLVIYCLPGRAHETTKTRCA